MPRFASNAPHIMHGSDPSLSTNPKDESQLRSHYHSLSIVREIHNESFRLFRFINRDDHRTINFPIKPNLNNLKK